MAVASSKDHLTTITNDYQGRQQPEVADSEKRESNMAEYEGRQPNRANLQCRHPYNIADLPGRQSTLADFEGRGSSPQDRLPWARPAAISVPRLQLVVDSVNNALVSNRPDHTGQTGRSPYDGPGGIEEENVDTSSLLALLGLDGWDGRQTHRPTPQSLDDDSCDDLDTTASITCSTLTKTATIVFLLGISVSMVMIGYLHLYDCPSIAELSRVLLFSGVVLALRVAVQLWTWAQQTCCSSGSGGGGKNNAGVSSGSGSCGCPGSGCSAASSRGPRLCALRLELILLVLAVGESVKVYSLLDWTTATTATTGLNNNKPPTSPSPSPEDPGTAHCAPLLYWFSFAAITSLYCLVVLSAFFPLLSSRCCRCRPHHHHRCRRCCSCLSGDWYY